MSINNNNTILNTNNEIIERIKVKASQVGGGDVKLFTSLDEMNNHTNNQEGDLAVVYGDEFQVLTADATFLMVKFADTFTLDTALTSSVSISIFDDTNDYNTQCRISMSSTSCYVRDYATANYIIRYTSADGLTYTKSEGENSYIFEQTMHLDGTWNDAFGKFIECGSYIYEGLYEYTTKYINKDYIAIRKLEDIEYDGTTTSFKNTYYYEYPTEELKMLVMKMEAISSAMTYWFYIGVDGNLYSVMPDDWYEFIEPVINGNFVFSKQTGSNETFSFKYYKYNTTTGTFDFIKNITASNLTSITGASSAYTYYKSDNDYLVKTASVIYRCSDSNQLLQDAMSVYADDYYTRFISNSNDLYSYKIEEKFAPAKCQLDATSDYVYNKTFFGKKGVEQGTVGQNVSSSFNDGNAIIFESLQSQYDMMEPQIITDTTKIIDSEIVIVPSKSDGTPLLDTSAATDLSALFRGCNKLLRVADLDTRNNTTIQNMFNGCTNLKKAPFMDTSNVTAMGQTFYGCKNMVEIPLWDTKNVQSTRSMFSNCESLITLPLLDLHNVTDSDGMFGSCKKLVNLPVLNLSKTTKISNMFYGCASLSDESLNNILQICTNMTSYTGTKTLAYISITEEQANKCKTLSNYQAFLNAGWTTGY